MTFIDFIKTILGQPVTHRPQELKEFYNKKTQLKK